jgi:ferredoxin
MKHGEGKKWYLEAKNYSEDLLSDMRRRKFIKKFFSELDQIAAADKRIEKLDKAPWLVKRFYRWRLKNFFKKNHHGQVVPIEDIEKIFQFTNSIVRTSCLCRHITHGQEKRYCYGISMGPNGGKFTEIINEMDGSFFEGPDSKGTETLTSDEALSAFREHEREGLCHSVWTFVTPFIAGICNCDRPDCLAMKTTVTLDIPSMYRAEYVAVSDLDCCNGCRQCMRVCQFGAISYSAGNEKAVIDPRRCFGCGICRAVCNKDAISLVDRSKEPLAANVW